MKIVYGGGGGGGVEVVPTNKNGKGNGNIPSLTQGGSIIAGVAVKFLR